MHRPAHLSATVLILTLVVLALAATSSSVFAQTVPATSPVPARATSPTAPPAPTPTATNESTTAATPDSVTLIAMPTRLGDDYSLKVKPGEKKQVILKVHNQSAKPVTVMSMVEDFIIGQDGKTPTAITTSEKDNRWSLASWITVAPNLQTVKPNETKAISAIIEVPNDALPGGHYAMITHQPETGNAGGANAAKSVGVSQKVGTLLYVVVEGPIMEEAFIRNLTVPQHLDFGPVPYAFTVDNNSDIHIQPKMTLNIYNFWNTKVFSEGIETSNIFPKAARQFNGKWDRVWGVGRYKAEIVMVYGTGAATVLASAFFWLFPIKLGLALLVIILTAVAIFISVRRHLIHRAEQQAKRVRELEETVAKLEKEQQTPPLE